MFELLELIADLRDLRSLGLEEEEVEGYIDTFFENYEYLFENSEVV